jgi:hypothetical protein
MIATNGGKVQMTTTTKLADFIEQRLLETTSLGQTAAALVSSDLVANLPEPWFSAEELADAVKTILDGFDKRLFVRSIANDNDSFWAIKLFPYLKALAVAQQVMKQ